MLKIGIVGMGVIGHRVAEALVRGIPGTALVGVSVRQAATAGSYPVLPLPTLIERSDLIARTFAPRLRTGVTLLYDWSSALWMHARGVRDGEHRSCIGNKMSA